MKLKIRTVKGNKPTYGIYHGRVKVGTVRYSFHTYIINPIAASLGNYLDAFEKWAVFHSEVRRVIETNDTQNGFACFEI